jgi:hypothetical protein
MEAVIEFKREVYQRALQELSRHLSRRGFPRGASVEPASSRMQVDVLER